MVLSRIIFIFNPLFKKALFIEADIVGRICCTRGIQHGHGPLISASLHITFKLINHSDLYTIYEQELFAKEKH